MSGLILHAGANVATEADVALVPTPDATDTWQPIPHVALLNSVRRAVEFNGFTVKQQTYGLWHDGARMFGVWTLSSSLMAPDYELAIGIRNSHDKTFPAGLAVGSRVFVCDNLAFSSEIVVTRKHTRWIMRDLDALVAGASGRIAEARQIQDLRIGAYKGTDLSDTQVHDVLVRSCEARVMAFSYLPKVLAEYRAPRHEDFAPRTAWSLFNAYTEVLKESPAQDLSQRTIRLHGLMDGVSGLLIPSQN